MDVCAAHGVTEQAVRRLVAAAAPAGAGAAVDRETLNPLGISVDGLFDTFGVAVNDARRPGTRVRILPGVYQESPSPAVPSPACAALGRRAGEYSEQALPWREEVACPHAQNLIAVLGKRGLQVEGPGGQPPGPAPGDAVIDAGYKKLNALFAERSPGIYLRNFTLERTTGNALRDPAKS